MRRRAWIGSFVSSGLRGGMAHPFVRSILPVATLLLVFGCSPKKLLVANVPPETTLFVQGPIDPVNHIVHLYWFGSDPDGNVARYQLRLKNPAAPADSAWQTTQKTDSVFT